MRALWSDRQNCSHNVSQEVKRIRRLSDKHTTAIVIHYGGVAKHYGCVLKRYDRISETPCFVGSAKGKD